MTPRVLVAEDDPDVLVMLKLILERDGAEVIVVRDADALGIALEHTPHLALVVADVYMPGTSGTALDVLERARAKGTSTPVLLVTAFADEQVYMHAAQLGVAGVMAKPFDVDDLRTAVLHLIAHARPSRPPGVISPPTK